MKRPRDTNHANGSGFWEIIFPSRVHDIGDYNVPIQFLSPFLVHFVVMVVYMSNFAFLNSTWPLMIGLFSFQTVLNLGFDLDSIASLNQSILRA